MIILPKAIEKTNFSIEEVIALRRSIREYLNKPLQLKDLAQILWAAQGITEPSLGLRSAPSAGATYPLEVYILSKNVENLKKGIYKYLPFYHALKVIREGDYSYDLYQACLYQDWVLNAAANIIITAIYERTTYRYGTRGIRYVHMEAGHVGQNIYLQATALKIGTVAIGAFYDEEVENIIQASHQEKVIYIFPLGYRK